MFDSHLTLLVIWAPFMVARLTGLRESSCFNHRSFLVTLWRLGPLCTPPEGEHPRCCVFSSCLTPRTSVPAQLRDRYLRLSHNKSTGSCLPCGWEFPPIISILISLMILCYFFTIVGSPAWERLEDEKPKGGDSGGTQGEEVFRLAHRNPEARGQTQCWSVPGPVALLAPQTAWRWITESQRPFLRGDAVNKQYTQQTQ